MKRRTALFIDLFGQVQDLKQGLLQHANASPGSISFSQKAVLFAVSLQGMIGCTRLARLMRITPSAATQHIEALEQAGYVTRQPDPKARRNVIIRLSEKGEAVVSHLKRERLVMAEQLCEEVSDQELEVLVTIVKKINYKLQTVQKGEHATS